MNTKTIFSSAFILLFLSGLSYGQELNDVIVTDIYTYGELPLNIVNQPLVSARLENASDNATSTIDVTLNVTGAETYTESQTISIAAQDTLIVHFTGYKPKVEGKHIITVSIPSDDNDDNNSLSYHQQVTSNTLNYADDSIPGDGSAGFQSESGLLMTRFIINESRKVNSVNVTISNSNTLINKKLYCVVVDEFGSILGTSDDWYPKIPDLGKEHIFQIISPPAITSNTSFFVGLYVTDPGIFPLAIQHETNPNPASELFFLGRKETEDMVAFQEADPAGGVWMMGVTFSSPVGVNEFTYTDKDFFVYPNPNCGQINLQFKEIPASEIIITISDIIGKQYYNHILNLSNLNENNINISHLPEGIYFIQLESDDHRYTEKLILTK